MEDTFPFFQASDPFFALILYMVPSVMHKKGGSLGLKIFLKFVNTVTGDKVYFKPFFSLFILGTTSLLS